MNDQKKENARKHVYIFIKDERFRKPQTAVKL